MSTRRILFAALGVSAAAGALELASLWGHFDYRKLARRLMRPKSYRQSLTRLQDHEQAAGQVIHVGHSTHLLSVAGMRLLTDPWFFDPAFGVLGESKQAVEAGCRCLRRMSRHMAIRFA